jgi:hypothetical protein
VQLRSWTATARNHPVRAKAAYDATSLLDPAHSNIRPASRGGRRLLNPVLSGLAASTHERPDIGRDTRLSRGGRYGPLRPLPPRPAQPWLSLSAGRLGLCVRGLDVEAIRAQFSKVKVGLREPVEHLVVLSSASRVATAGSVYSPRGFRYRPSPSARPRLRQSREG